MQRRLAPLRSRRKPLSRRLARPRKPPEKGGHVNRDLASLVDGLASQALGEVAASGDLSALDDVRVRWLGKKGTLTEQLKTLGALPADQRREAGQKINEAKQQLEA